MYEYRNDLKWRMIYPAPSGQPVRLYENPSGIWSPPEPAPKPHVPEAPVSSNVPRGGFGKRVL